MQVRVQCAFYQAILGRTNNNQPQKLQTQSMETRPMPCSTLKMLNDQNCVWLSIEMKWKFTPFSRLIFCRLDLLLDSEKN